jgi:hypothetical protein
LIHSRDGVDLACLLFGAAAWQCAARDRWIGWSSSQRTQGLAFIAQSSQFARVMFRMPMATKVFLSCFTHRSMRAAEDSLSRALASASQRSASSVNVTLWALAAQAADFLSEISERLFREAQVGCPGDPRKLLAGPFDQTIMDAG